MRTSAQSWLARNQSVTFLSFPCGSSDQNVESHHTLESLMDRPSCHLLKIFAALAAGMLVCACTKMQSVLPDDLGRLASLVVPGDTVSCHFRDGSTAELKVSTVEPNTIIEESGNRVAIASITSAKIEHFDGTKSILLGLAIVAMLAATFVLSATALGSRSDISFVAEDETAQPRTNEGS